MAAWWASDRSPLSPVRMISSRSLSRMRNPSRRPRTRSMSDVTVPPARNSRIIRYAVARLSRNSQARSATSLPFRPDGFLLSKSRIASSRRQASSQRFSAFSSLCKSSIVARVHCPDVASYHSQIKYRTARSGLIFNYRVSKLVRNKAFENIESGVSRLNAARHRHSMLRHRQRLNRSCSVTFAPWIGRS